jgi:phage shock protein PspC (stress-responsive transcriptional regulator)
MADLEQAIADKCAHFLRPHKNVVSAEEIDSLIKEMGPVQTDAPGAGGAAETPGAEAARPRAAAEPTARRLYQIREGAMLSGVCTGIAAYFNVDVTIVRIIFVVLALFSGGLWALAYLVMMLVIPFANTDEEHAAAAGTPFNAQEVVDRAKKHYAQFKNDADWRRHWRQQRREGRRRWKDGAYWWGHNLQRNVYQMSAQTGYFAQVFAGLMIPVLAIVGTALLIAFIASLVAITTTGTLFGWVVVGSLPLWAAALVLCLVYGLMASSLHNLRRAIYMNRGAAAAAASSMRHGTASSRWSRCSSPAGSPTTTFPWCTIFSSTFRKTSRACGTTSSIRSTMRARKNSPPTAEIAAHKMLICAGSSSCRRSRWACPIAGSRTAVGVSRHLGFPACRLGSAL